jgi:Ca2+-transporting ATPase
MEIAFNPENVTGLSEKEAGEILKEQAYNELPSQKKQSLFSILLHVLKESILLILLGACLIYLFLGEVKDALILLTFVFVVVGITFNQEKKTERALEVLKNLSSPRVLVIRDGEQKRISGREVVKDDILILREGDRIPVDAVVLSCTHLLVDESLLTGESLAVRKSKSNDLIQSLQPGGDDMPFVYSGTLVIQGHGVAQVIGIGIYTEIWKIEKALGTIAEEDSLLEKETVLIVKNFAILGGILCALVVVVLRANQRRLVAWPAGRTEFEHVSTPGRIFSYFIHIPEYGRMAHVQKECFGTAHACYRDSWLLDSVMRG